MNQVKLEKYTVGSKLNIINIRGHLNFRRHLIWRLEVLGILRTFIFACFETL